VKRHRKFLGWTQKTLVAKCQIAGFDITRDMVAAIEGRVRSVSDFELLIFSRILQVPVMDLLPDRAIWKDLIVLTEE